MEGDRLASSGRITYICFMTTKKQQQECLMRAMLRVAEEIYPEYHKYQFSEDRIYISCWMQDETQYPKLIKASDLFNEIMFND
jgi:hypothetical protein